MKAFRRPNAPGVSREKVGLAGAIATLLGVVAAKLFGVEVPEDLLLALAGVIIAGVHWRARNRRGMEERPVRSARLR